MYIVKLANVIFNPKKGIIASCRSENNSRIVIINLAINYYIAVFFKHFSLLSSH